MRSLALILSVTACHAATYYNGGDYYQTDNIPASCPTNYQPIRDEKACKEVAAAIDGKVFNAIYHRYNVNPFPNFCTAKNGDAVDINYYVNPDGEHTDVQVSMMCIKSSKTCSVEDGAGPSASYPCVCGTDTCADGEVCDKTGGDNSSGICEVIKGYYETERGDASCPSGYQAIKDAFACQQLAEMIPSKFWGAVYSLNEMPYGCSSWNTNQVNYYYNPSSNPGGRNEEVDAAILCIKTTMTCSVSNGAGPSSDYPCVCGQDTCSTNEVCDSSYDGGKGICEVAKGYVETEREATSCPTGYKAILDAAACREAAGKLGGTQPKYWGSVYLDPNVPHGCGTWLATRANTVNYYLNPGFMDANNTGSVAANTNDVENAMLCLKATELCTPTDGSAAATSTPCLCGDDTCAAGEVCKGGACEVIKDYFETERTAKSCPTGYRLATEPECWDLNNKLGRTWIKFPVYSGAGYGCGSWDFDTVTYFDYPPPLGSSTGGAPKDDNLYVDNKPDDTENARLCVSDTYNPTFDVCQNPYTWAQCI